jgi:hypothetical protein
MKRLQLDFSPHRTRLRNTMGGVVFVVCLLAGFALLASQRSLDERISQYAAQQDQPGKRMGSNARRTPLLLAEEKQAREAQHALDMPWNSLLGALEQAQSVSSGVHLLSVQPNPAKGEVMLAGETEDFATLMDYVKALRTQPQFFDVVLVNQRLTDDKNQTRLAFTLLAQWKP